MLDLQDEVSLADGCRRLACLGCGHEGWFSRHQLIERYQLSTGRDVSDIGWYTAFAQWRRACIGEGIYARYRAGAMGNDDFDVEAQGRLVILLAETARQALEAAR